MKPYFLSAIILIGSLAACTNDPTQFVEPTNKKGSARANACPYASSLYNHVWTCTSDYRNAALVSAKGTDPTSATYYNHTSLYFSDIDGYNGELYISNTLGQTGSRNPGLYYENQNSRAGFLAWAQFNGEQPIYGFYDDCSLMVGRILSTNSTGYTATFAQYDVSFSGTYNHVMTLVERNLPSDQQHIITFDTPTPTGDPY